MWARCVIRIRCGNEGRLRLFQRKEHGHLQGRRLPEDIGRFYRLEEYEGYAWTCHGRYPDQYRPAGGAARIPSGCWNLSVVHNGEISSYDANRRYMEMFGYRCTLQTDSPRSSPTSSITCSAKRGLTLQEIAHVIAASFWSTIANKEEHLRANRRRCCAACSPPCSLPGPSPSSSATRAGLMALGDRLKLRSMVCAEKGDKAYISSEESAIRKIEPSLDRIFAPAGRRTPSSMNCTGGATDGTVYPPGLRSGPQYR